MKGKKIRETEEEEEEEELESELEGQQEAGLEPEAQCEPEIQELGSGSKDKKKVSQERGLSTLASDQSVLQAESPRVVRLEPGRVEG